MNRVRASRGNVFTLEINESEFDYNYVPPHLQRRVEDCRKLSVGERLELTCELSLAA